VDTAQAWDKARTEHVMDENVPREAFAFKARACGGRVRTTRPRSGGVPGSDTPRSSFLFRRMATSRDR
jgi:hypothetical protein